MNSHRIKAAYIVVVSIFSLFVLLDCHVVRNFQQRFEVDEIISNLKKNRASQIEFKKTHDGNFGTIDDLISDGLLDPGVKKSTERNFTIDLALSKSKYALRLVPIDRTKTYANNGVEILSYYLDESGVIRFSLDPNKQADYAGDPIADQ